MIIVAFMAMIMIGGCTAKEFKDGANGIANDISNVFEEGKDKSAD